MVRESVGRVRKRVKCGKGLNWGQHGFNRKVEEVGGRGRLEASEAGLGGVEAREKGRSWSDFRGEVWQEFAEELKA